ncbi:MAG: YHS domain-containing protein [Bacillota bacterium]|nr:YHS domain-containing protein [Bacillota bacterium]
MMTKGGGCCGGHSHGTHSQDGSSQSGGCCGGHSHSNHGDENHGHDGSQNQINELETVKDPICGMKVNPDTAIKQIIDDKTYYFCSESCRKEFLSKQRTI